MASGYGLMELLSFLDYLSNKGLLNKNTAISRKASCNKMLGILGEDETADLRGIDLDQVETRFANLVGTKYTPKSIRVYKSRVKTSLDDFFRYKENPANFKLDKPNGKKGSGPKGEAPAKLEVEDYSRSETAMSAPRKIDIPVALRPGCIIQINGVPVDLSKAEAHKIANVIIAQAMVPDD